ncbi:hypothetical protein GH714_030154 [Hevea brasiliensis]|uniref:Pentacotripeptide-repeat region of PRORP domain-containing protein n=1 Tax=Hevea brasiliensis TaxID=3981 RepID=A0A6A6L0X5_HEVBR|nr:hypothetical protein GH714_030154 [Hevea brasiliensis]
MYAKCGDLQTAQVVFDSMLERSVVSWSVMIAGYGMHGNVDASISLFTQMVRLGIKPNDITFMNILSACSHAGYVEEGKFYFNLMKDFGVDPSSEHFACMVDLLSRVEAGNWDESRKVRSVMKCIGLKKVPGYSTIELEKKIYRFGAGDVSLANKRNVQPFGKFSKFGSGTIDGQSISEPVLIACVHELGQHYLATLWSLYSLSYHHHTHQLVKK